MNKYKIMDCKRVLEIGVNEVTFNDEITLAIDCIIKVQKNTKDDFKEVSNEIIIAMIDNRNKTRCLRKIYQYEKNGIIIGTLECYMAMDYSFIEIFHH